MHAEPPVARFANGEFFSGGPVTADVTRQKRFSSLSHAMISGNWQSFKSTHKKKWKWPTEKFEDAGKRLKLADVFDLPFTILDQQAAMLLWCNGGVPSKRWVHAENGPFEIDRFLSIGGDSDLSQTILWARNYLPRFSVPLAYVHNPTGDIAFFLTFPFDEAELGRENKVWYYTWFHEETPRNPDDTSMLVEVAPTIKKLIDKLKPEPPKGYFVDG